MAAPFVEKIISETAKIIAAEDEAIKREKISLDYTIKKLPRLARFVFFAR
jgi:hypothetical protein